MNKNKYSILLVLFLLLIGIIYRLLLTAHGNFLFHIDNARDMVDVREMVVLHKWRLIGPTSGVEGFYNGPAWYYIMAIPFLLSGGDPYSMIILEFIFWLIGGWFLFLLIKRAGRIALLSVGGIWIVSPLLILYSENSLSTNPILFLMPLFFWLLFQSLQSQNKINYFLLGIWGLAGIFFHLEMAFGFLLPPILLIISLLFLPKKWKEKSLWLGVLLWSVFLLPQLVFDMRHQWVMTQGIIRYLEHQSAHQFNIVKRIGELWSVYKMDFSGLLLNNVYIVWLVLVIILLAGILFIKNKLWQSHLLFTITAMFILLSFSIYLVVPIAVMPWHILAEMSATVLLFGLAMEIITERIFWGKWLCWLMMAMIIFSGITTAGEYLQNGSNLTNDSSLYRNEITAIDWVYQHANGQGFKAYTYLPSIIDYPYQYLYWWYGLKQYGYTPADYAYLPQQPEYISNRLAFIKTNGHQLSSSIFLIEESDRIGLRGLWENNFKQLPLTDRQQVGPLLVEQRKETKDAHLD